jgi:uncharacterized protein
VTEPEFIRLQRSFTRHLRNPEQQGPPPGHEDRRMAIYRRAVFANIEAFMKDNYPRLRVVMDDAQWNAMVRDYLIRHASAASAFVDLPLEFLEYLEKERDDRADPPFLRELAHFDWLETLVGADERRIDLTGIDRSGDLINGIPAPNPILEMVVYRYPVHTIGPEYQPVEPPPVATRIAAFRDLDNLYGFLDLSGASARLLELIVEQRERTGYEIFQIIADELCHDDASVLIEAGRAILERMRERTVILGTRRLGSF